MTKFLFSVYHPQAEELEEKIYEVTEDGKEEYYFEVNGDWYTNLQECIDDASKQLDQKYRGTFYTPCNISRDEAFAAGNY